MWIMWKLTIKDGKTFYDKAWILEYSKHTKGKLVRVKDAHPTNIGTPTRMKTLTAESLYPLWIDWGLPLPHSFTLTWTDST